MRAQRQLLVEFATETDLIQTQTLPGCWLKRSWLNPEVMKKYLGSAAVDWWI
jgi:hypothetical protein